MEVNLKDVSEEAIYSAMLGAVTSFLLESPGATTNAYVDNAIEKAEYQKKVDALKTNRNAAGTLDFVQNAEYNYNKQYSKKTSYWKPDLSKRQMNRLMAEIRKDVQIGDNNLTDKANWLVADIEGTPVLAIYSTENTQEPTLLYESKGAQAENEREILSDIMEVRVNGKSFNGESGAFGTVSSGGWVQQNGDVQNSAGSLGGTRSSANASVLQRQSKGKPTRAFINVIENLTTERGRVNNKEEAADVGATSTASSLYSEGVETASPIKPGFTPTDYSKKIGNKTLRALDAIGKRIGVEISIGAPTGDGKGAHNGYYENGRIVIAQDAKNPLEVVLCHEVTHHMQRTAPAEYNVFVELAINAAEKISGAEKTDLINRYRQAYEDGNVETFSDQAAINEITADFASGLVNDISLFNDLARSNRNVAVRFIESVKEFLAKVKSTFSGDKAKADTASLDKYGARVSELEAAVTQWEKMLSTTETAVASGNINTVGNSADGEANVFVKLKNSVPLLENMSSVKNLTGKEFAKSEKNIIEQVTDFFNSIGNKVKRIGFGEVLLNKQGAKDDLGHGIGRAKAVTFAAVPEVIKNGKQIDYQENWKGRGEDSYIFAAPVEIKGKRGYVAAVVLRDATNRFYLHEVVDGEGNVFQIKNEGTSKSFKTASFDEIELIRDKDVPSNLIIHESSEKSNRKNSLKTEDLLSRDYGKDTTSSGKENKGKGLSEELETEEFRAESKDTSPRRTTESYIDETGLLDEYFEDLSERANVISDERFRAAESAVMTKPKKDKKKLGEKISESVSYAKRKMVNSGDSIRKIAKVTKDEHLYGIYNRARSSMNIVSDMLKNKQTNVLGQKVGESLEGIIAPIKERGDEYFRDFQLYLLHKHNVARMGLKDTKAEARAERGDRCLTNIIFHFSIRPYKARQGS